MRVLAIDVGQRRVGLAISDRTQTLARPLATITVERGAPDRPEGPGGPGGPGGIVQRIAREVETLAAEEDGLAEIVVGLPVSLNGEATAQTRVVSQFVDALRARTTIPIVTADERLTSREAEARLAVTERDWRKRKQQLDAAAAAIILQDYLDRGHR